MSPQLQGGAACNCTQDWSGAACEDSPYPLLNCTSRLQQDVVPVVLHNHGANALRVAVCSAGSATCGAAGTDCAGVVQPSASVDLWLPSTATTVVATLCDTSGSDCAPHLNLTFAKPASGKWAHLTVPASTQVFCDSAQQCSNSVRMLRSVVSVLRCCEINLTHTHLPFALFQQLCVARGKEAPATPYSGWLVCTDCPRGIGSRVCNDQGTCHAPATGSAGYCSCTGGWSGASCRVSPYSLLNCTDDGSGAISVHSFVNHGANALELFTCATPAPLVAGAGRSVAGGAGVGAAGCGPANGLQCHSQVAPNSTVEIWMPADHYALAAVVCTPGGGTCFTDKQYSFERSASKPTEWSPPLAVAAVGGVVYCDSSANCGDAPHPARVRKAGEWGHVVHCVL